jgi:hypothetical protein
VFWNRAAQEARRQKVLDELIELTPDERRLRMDRAVTEGDIRPEEVAQALRLVERLDALRAMAIPGPRSEEAPVVANTEEPVEPEPAKPAVKLSRHARRRAGLKATTAVIDPVRRSATQRGNRAIARDAAAQSAMRAVGGSPRRRGPRFAASASASGSAAAAADLAGAAASRSGQLVAATAADGSVGVDPGLAVATPSEARSEEQWPSISWLRPE